MRKKRSAISIILSFLTILILSSCSAASPSDKDNTGFKHFTNELFCQEVSANTLSLHYTIQNPETFDIKNAPVSLGTYSTDTAAMSASVENCLAALHKFDYNKLSKKNQLTYDVLETYLKTSLDGVKYTLYDEPLSPLTGIQAQFPVLLSEYQFHSAEDIDTYLELMKKTPEYFDSLISFEQTKSSSGLFMASYIADDIIKECESFILMGDSNYLYSSFINRLEHMDDISDEQKNAYITENEKLVKTCIFPSYEKLKTELMALRTSGNNNNGLCYYPDGTAYYEYVVKRDTGSDRSILELQDLTRSQMVEDLTAMQEILSKKASDDSTAASGTAITFEDSNPTSILNDLKGKITDSFPTPPEVNTEVKYVQKEMEEFLSPAFYMVPAIDNVTENVIYINQGHLPDDLDLYTTLAHEGYPGHLYQTVYYASQDPDPIRNILNFGGYTEGWATYTEMLSYYYAPITKEQSVLMQRNTSVILGLYALADMGIHYDGWTLADAVSFFHEYGITDTQTIENIYDLIIADPGNYLKYYIGYVEFLELKKEAIQKWGDDFTQKKFHEFVLDMGPAPFEVIRKRI